MGADSSDEGTKALFRRERNGTERNAIVPKSGTLRGCVQTGPLQIEPFRSKSWTYSISDTKSGIGPFRSVPFPSEQTSGRMSKVRV